MSAPGLQHDRAAIENDETLRAALQDANLPTLLLVLYQLTGDDAWLSDPFCPSPTPGLGDHNTGGLLPHLQEEVRRDAFAAITAWRRGELETLPAPAPERVAELLAFALAEDVPAEYGELLAEEAGFLTRDVRRRTTRPAAELDVLVIGAGMAGINIAIALSGLDVPYTIIEKNDAVGGTWLENDYPGCGVDTPSHLYSFSFARRANWREYFGLRNELESYFHDVAEDHGVHEHVQFGTELLSASWHPGDQRWVATVRRTDGTETTLTAAVLISAVGHFNRPSLPDVRGLDTFPGPCMHTAKWDSNVEVAGKRVGVLGTGASSMQLVPALAGTAERVTVFQSSRQWIIPHPNAGQPVPDGVQYLLEHVPYYAEFYRLRHFWRFGDRLHPALRIDPSYPNPDEASSEINARHRRFLTRYIEQELAGRPDLVEASVPAYPPYAKRPLIDRGWFRTIRRPDVDLIDSRVVEVRGNTVITADGQETDVDVLALATGFKTLEILGPMTIVGRSGHSLRDTWGPEEARAYLGITVPDFPNFFILFGPNTNTGHGGSAFLTTEMQVRYVADAIATMADDDLATVECCADVYDAYNTRVDDALSRLVYTHPKVHGYYRNRNGRVIGSNPWEYLEYDRMTRSVNLAEFVVTERDDMRDTTADSR